MPSPEMPRVNPMMMDYEKKVAEIQQALERGDEETAARLKNELQQARTHQ